MSLIQCFSDAFKQQKQNLDNGGLKHSGSSPAADGEEHSNPSAGSPAICSTRAQKVSFLKGLSAHDHYKTACRMLRGRLITDDINGLPDWASWSFGKAYPPESFYDVQGLQLAITAIAAVASSVDAMEYTLVLAFGFALRGLVYARETNGGTPSPEAGKNMALIDAAEETILSTIELTV